jgi:hypothetical protein
LGYNSHTKHNNTTRGNHAENVSKQPKNKNKKEQEQEKKEGRKKCVVHGFD